MRHWTPYLARRAGSTAIVLVGVVAITFVVTRVLGTPVYLLAGQQGGREQIAEIEQSYGLDKPVPVQFANYVGDLAGGDLGTSRRTGNAVTDDIWDRLPATVELVLAAMIITVVIAVPLGIAAARRRGGLLDRVGGAVTLVGASVPNFWLGLIFIYICFYELQIAPPPDGRLPDDIAPPTHVTGLYVVDGLLSGHLEAVGAALGRLVLPALTLSLVSIPATFQITRNTFISILDGEPIRTARAFGLPPRTIYFKYALKNALVPLVTVLAMSFGFLMSGTVLVESVFGWPGIGLYALDSTKNFDYDPVIGVVLLSAVVYALAYLVADAISYAVDPRTRTRGAA